MTGMAWAVISRFAGAFAFRQLYPKLEVKLEVLTYTYQPLRDQEAIFIPSSK